MERRIRNWWFACIAIGLFLNGCASYSQMMIGPNGNIKRCAASGHGPIGVGMAGSMQSDCIESARAAGFIELERSGVLGINTSDVVEPGGGIRILKVIPNSPAAAAGIKAGGVLYKINGQDIRSKADSKILLFGEAGSNINVTIKANNEEKDYNLVKESYTKIYGYPGR